MREGFRIWDLGFRRFIVHRSAFIVFFALWLCISAVSLSLWAQQAAPLQLTELEQTRLALMRERAANIQLQIQALNQQMENLKAEYPKVVAEAAKAHGVDLKTHRLKADGTGFEPVPVEKAEVKK